MAKKRLSESEIKGILEQVANGAKPTDLAKEHGFSLGSFYNWKNKHEGGAKKTTAKKAGRPAKKAAAKPAAKRGRPAKKATAAAAKPAASNKKADALFTKIKSLESQIEKAKIAYANAILGK